MLVSPCSHGVYSLGRGNWKKPVSWHIVCLMGTSTDGNDGRQAIKRGFPGSSVGKESACQCRRCWFDPWIGKIPWRRKWHPNPGFLPGKSHGQRSLVGYSRGLAKSRARLGTAPRSSSQNGRLRTSSWDVTWVKTRSGFCGAPVAASQRRGWGYIRAGELRSYVPPLLSLREPAKDPTWCN